MKEKRKEISVDIRNLIIKLKQQNKSYNEIVKITKIKRSTVQSIVKKFETTGTVLNKSRSGRPRVLNDHDIRMLIKNVNKNPTKSAPELAAELAFSVNKTVHPEIDLNFWEHVLFTDESKFNIFRSDRKGKVWRKANEELKTENLIPTVKYGGGGVMVWGSMAASGVGELVFIEENMNASVACLVLENRASPTYIFCL
ncbi:unnamed protein product [Euphydryas editha]|uniref:Sleeping Beauty transposase HTH domain-containing protein n=1 Tax=Euphydryas editha TaxID=104508 RepID=A0AAU9TVP0_EUPED|nr:unnamed protein product [Euphydryas editha]